MIFDSEHEAFRRVCADWVAREVAPHVDGWEEAGTPRELFAAQAKAGLIGVWLPVEYGGQGATKVHEAVFVEELARCGSGGVAADLGAHAEIALPPILAYGTEAQRRRWLVPGTAGEAIAALAITEPGGGSDVANLATTATREGDEYVVSGAKMFITGGNRADVLVVAVRTGEPGHRGVSTLLIEGDRPGVRRGRPLRKLGWHASDTAELGFDAVRVPVANRLGGEGEGFAQLMGNFAWERITMALGAVAAADQCLTDTIGYARGREVFGRPVTGFQRTRHTLAGLATELAGTRALAHAALAAHVAGDPDALWLTAMAKRLACDLYVHVADECLQLHGGYGYMAEYRVGRHWRDARLGPIGGGTREVMDEIIARSLGA